MSSPVVAIAEATTRPQLQVAVFVTTLGLSAFLLFGVQPMFAKMVLPILGGSPSVWSVATVVFQSLLLAGYAYAHWLASRGTRTGALIHLAVMALAATSLPIAIGPNWQSAPGGGEGLWLVGLILAAIGLPFLAVSANGPLLQAWFSRTGHPTALDPYFLYAASNIGSFAALAAYPVLIEPYLTLRAQSVVWAGSFAVLAILVASSAMLTGERIADPRVRSGAIAPSWRQRGGWMAPSFVSSGLIVAVTAHISVDVAAVPLLWVVPLALYLLSFVVVFRATPMIGDRPLAFAQAAGTAFVIAGIAPEKWLWLSLGLHLGLFFVNVLICHGTLYRRRPPAEHLTDFYLCTAFGGALGGLFCALLAPILFSTLLEYPILLAAAFLCRPDLAASAKAVRHQVATALIAIAIAIAALHLALALGANWGLLWRVLLIVASTALIVMWRRSAALAAFALAMGFAPLVFQAGGAGVESVRSFFGIHRIMNSDDGRFRILAHGTTIHGAMRLREDDGTPSGGRPEPTTYYTTEGAIATAIRSVRQAHGGALGPVSLVGLGAGSMACHAPWNERWTFYEIDPEVARIARDPARFRFLSDCAPDIPIVLGDARLTLAGSPPGQSLVLVDAFSSDAIPVHLVTREALELYLAKLAPDGALVFHVSNRHLDLTRILARIGAEFGLAAFLRDDTSDEPYSRRMRSDSIVVAMARKPADLGPMATDGTWTRLQPDLQRRPWTDDYSNILEALLDARRR